MTDKINLEIDESFINKFFEITGTKAPVTDKVDLNTLKNQLQIIAQEFSNIKDENKKLKSSTQEQVYNNEQNVINSNESNNNAHQLAVPMNYNQPTLKFIEPNEIKREKYQYYDDNGQPVKGKMLVIDDLGVITYQLSVILKRAGYLPVASKEIYDAVDKYKRSPFDFVIMDLFIPTEREGLILLDELKKIAAARKETPLIAIMSASSKKEHKQECQKRGAAFYIEKVDDWQKELFNIILQYDNQASS